MLSWNGGSHFEEWQMKWISNQSDDPTKLMIQPIAWGCVGIQLWNQSRLLFSFPIQYRFATHSSPQIYTSFLLIMIDLLVRLLYLSFWIQYTNDYWWIVLLDFFSVLVCGKKTVQNQRNIIMANTYILISE